jgi:hypothetical protein
MELIRMGAASYFAEQVKACVNVVQVEFGQCLVDESKVFKSTGQPRADILFQIDLDVV